MLIFVRRLIFGVFILLYGLSFIAQERTAQYKNVKLEFSLPANFYRVISGYFKQLISELIFVRTSVFLGSVQPGLLPATYEDALSNNFEVMTKLYPQFVDPYYYCQAFLTSISAESATNASKIFETGVKANPNDLVLRFFHAQNFLTMDEPIKAANAFTEAAKLQNAPAMFGHLAALLSAHGGDISAGLISLEILLKDEKNEIVRSRYQEEIRTFQKALEVQRALNAYILKYASEPKSLNQLIPEFIPGIPKIDNSFILFYNPPNLHLKRPDKSGERNAP